MLNLSLQVWDGLATYYGLSHGVQEGNPLLQCGIDALGVGVALVSVKSATCGLLWFLYQVAYLSLARWMVRRALFFKSLFPITPRENVRKDFLAPCFQIAKKPASRGAN